MILLFIASIANRRHSSSIISLLTPLQASAYSSDTMQSSSSNNSRTVKRKRTAKPAHDLQQQPWYYKYTKGDPLYTNYMRNEWSHEKETDDEIFEKLSLDGAQAGLSWRTILHKREAYRRAFYNFDINKVAKMTNSDIDHLMTTRQQDESKKDATGSNSSIVVRHRGKLESVVNNAQLIQKLKAEGTIATTFSSYLWSFVNHKPILNSWASFDDIPSKTTESEAMSKELKALGFKFVGPTTCYAFMQSCGFVIDHVRGCEEWLEAEKRLKKRNGGYQCR